LIGLRLKYHSLLQGYTNSTNKKFAEQYSKCFWN